METTRFAPCVWAPSQAAVASNAHQRTSSLAWHDTALVDATETKAHVAKPERDNLHMSERASFVWSTLEQGLKGETSHSSKPSTASCDNTQSDGSTTIEDIGYGDEYEFVLGMLREAGLLETHTKERQREYQLPTEMESLNAPGYVTSPSHPVTRNAGSFKGKSQTYSEISCHEHEFLVLGTRNQRHPSSSTTSTRVQRSKQVPADSIRSSQCCDISVGRVCGICSSDCLIISVGRRGVTPQAESSQPITMPLPQSPAERAALGAHIWRAFEVRKERNDSERDLALKTRQKRPLREVAPIPWLRWRAKDGRSGQFRSQQNFEAWWASNVVAKAEDLGNGTAWLTVQV